MKTQPSPFLLLLILPIRAFTPTDSSHVTRLVSKHSPLSATAASRQQSRVSQDLLRAVLEKPQDLKLIQNLVQDLVDNSGSSWSYDPNESLFGPLFCTVAAFTPNQPNQEQPLWERISLKKDNIKGQQYTANADSTTSGSVINYSEVWGPSFNLRATGTFVSAGTKAETKEVPKAWWDGILGDTRKSSTLRKCPDDFTVTVSGASINLGGLALQLPIQGSSTLRVLYADPNLRVFVSPQASDSLAGEWENAGLVVVQVRSDLVTGSLIDLR